MTPKNRRVDAANELELFTEDAMVHFRDLGRRRDARIEKANAKRADKGLNPHPLGCGPDFDQMARNLLLTEAYRIRNRLTTAVNYVLAPKFDEQAEPLVRSTVDRLTDKHKRIARYRTLDAVVDAALPPLEDSDAGHVLSTFRSRYLDLSPAEQGLTGWLETHRGARPAPAV